MAVASLSAASSRKSIDFHLLLATTERGSHHVCPTWKQCGGHSLGSKWQWGGYLLTTHHLLLKERLLLHIL